MIDNIDIHEKIVSNEFSFDKQDFKYFIGYKHSKEIRPLCILFPEISMYKRYSGKTRCNYFMKKDKKNLINIWQFGKKLAI